MAGVAAMVKSLHHRPADEVANILYFADGEAENILVGLDLLLLRRSHEGRNTEELAEKATARMRDAVRNELFRWERYYASGEADYTFGTTNNELLISQKNRSKYIMARSRSYVERPENDVAQSYAWNNTLKKWEVRSQYNQQQH